MKKTTVYLPDELKRRLEAAARAEDRSEADVIRDAIAAAVSRHAAAEPRVPLSGKPLGDPTFADRVDELLDGFGL